MMRELPKLRKVLRNQRHRLARTLFTARNSGLAAGEISIPHQVV